MRHNARIETNKELIMKYILNMAASVVLGAAVTALFLWVISLAGNFNGF